MLLQADFVETTPIPVHLAVSESDSVPPLPADSAPPTFGGPLTPVLRRYTEGDQLASMEITHEVNCCHVHIHTNENARQNSYTQSSH